MYKIWDEKFVANSQICSYDTLVSCKQTGWYKVIILSAHISGTARTVVSFSGKILNNSESYRMYCSANVSTFLIATLEVCKLFCAKYR